MPFSSASKVQLGLRKSTSFFQKNLSSKLCLKSDLKFRKRADFGGHAVFGSVGVFDVDCCEDFVVIPNYHQKMVMKFDFDGNLLKSAKLNDDPYKVSVSQKHNLIAVGCRNSLQLFDCELNQLRTVEQDSLRGVAISDVTGNIFVKSSRKRILCYTQKGEKLVDFPFDCKFGYLGGLTVDEMYRPIIVTMDENEKSHLVKFDREGNIVAKSEEVTYGSWRLDSDGDGNIFYTNFTEILVFDANFRYSHSLLKEELKKERAACCNSDSLIVLEGRNDGPFITVWKAD